MTTLIKLVITIMRIDSCYHNKNLIICFEFIRKLWHSARKSTVFCYGKVREVRGGRKYRNGIITKQCRNGNGKNNSAKPVYPVYPVGFFGSVLNFMVHIKTITTEERRRREIFQKKLSVPLRLCGF